MSAETVVRSQTERAASGSPFVPGVGQPEPCTIVIFGATGDLAARKLLPALFGLCRGQYLPEQCIIIGVGRREKTDQAFREEVQAALERFRPDAKEAGSAQALLSRIY